MLKGGARFFGMVIALMLLVVGGVMYVSDGRQIDWDDFGLIGFAGLMVLFILADVAFIISVRRQGGSVLAGL